MADPIALEERDVQLLIKLLRMLAAPSVGERAAAALKVSEFVESRGLDWADLILPEGAGGMPDVQVTVAGDPPPQDPFTVPITPAMRAQAQAWMAAQQAAMNAAQAYAQPNPAPNQGLGGLGAAMANAAPPGGGSSRIWNGPAWQTPYQQPPRQQGQTFTYQIHPGAVPSHSAQVAQHGGVLPDWRAAVAAVTTFHANVLKGSREEKFLEDLLARKYPTLTPKQEAWLRNIAARANLSWT